MIPDIVAARISEIARTVPRDLVKAAAVQIKASAHLSWQQARNAVLNELPHAEVRRQIGDLLNIWQQAAPAVSRQALAYALAAAAQAVQETRQEQDVALVWTGPTVDGPSLRRTDQALQEVIQAARRDLLLVSFAIYMTPHIRQALVNAARRGVTIRIALETEQASGGRIDYDTIRSLGPAVARHAELYIWPAERRGAHANGKLGALHAKCAVADRQLLFISSANLTGYALTINMELGVMIRGGSLPGDVATHFDRLMEHRILEKLNV